MSTAKCCGNAVPLCTYAPQTLRFKGALFRGLVSSASGPSADPFGQVDFTVTVPFSTMAPGLAKINVNTFGSMRDMSMPIMHSNRRPIAMPQAVQGIWTPYSIIFALSNVAGTDKTWTATLTFQPTKAVSDNECAQGQWTLYMPAHDFATTGVYFYSKLLTFPEEQP